MNPYSILNVNKNSTQQEIMQAVAIAMKEKKVSVNEIALAQKALLNNQTKSIHDFINFLNLDVCDKMPLPSLSYDNSTICRLNIFDDDIK